MANRAPRYTGSTPKVQGKYHSWYNDHQYRKQRALFLAHPDNAVCACGRAATQLDHVVPFARGATLDEQLRLFNDPKNWSGICSKCHNKKSQAERAK